MTEYDGVTAHATDPFAPARKEQQKLRLALDGPSGSGKTFSALIAATVIVEAERALNPDAGGIAVIDTEHGSSALYADQFDFSVVNLDPPYSPARYIGLLRAAVEHGYSVVIVDSLSHGWNAEGGVLDMVDNAQDRSGGNKWAAWREGTPAQNALIDAIVRCPAHVIATLRTKQEWVLEDNGNGTKTPKRVGMAPVQRDGIEYEFTIVADLDLEHRLVVSKSRARPIADRVVVKPGPQFFGDVVDWLRDGTPMATPAQLEQIATVSAALSDESRQTANAWWKDRRLVMARLSADEATETLTHLATLADADTAAAKAAEKAERAAQKAAADAPASDAVESSATVSAGVK